MYGADKVKVGQNQRGGNLVLLSLPFFQSNCCIWGEPARAICPVHAQSSFCIHEEVYIEGIKRGLKEYAVVCTHGSINVCYVHTNSMVHPEAIFLMYPQDYVSSTCCRSRYLSYFLATLREVVKHISERDVVRTCCSQGHLPRLTPEQLVDLLPINFIIFLCFNSSSAQF